jgi:hypothetical protein
MQNMQRLQQLRQLQQQGRMLRGATANAANASAIPQPSVSIGNFKNKQFNKQLNCSYVSV